MWALWGQSANEAPRFTAPVLALPDGRVSEPYTGQSLADHAADPEVSTLTFTKLHGPSWLAVAPDGTLSGTPGFGDLGESRFVVRVADPAGAGSDAELVIDVSFQDGPVAHWNFEEGTNNGFVSYALPGAGQYDGSIPDVSGNGNHLSVWDNNWHRYRNNVPGSTTPQSGVANNFSVQNANNFPVMTAIGTPLTAWSPREWTIEAAIRPDDATRALDLCRS